MNHLPFAALRNPESGKYLIEERVIESVPSARTYLLSLEAASRRRRLVEPGSILLVADPEFNAKALPFLLRLPGSRKEVGRIKEVFGRAEILQDQAATKRALFSRIPYHSILHLATHAVTNERDPMFSYIALAPEGDSGMLFAHELYQADLKGVDLVFLAGCNTASGPISQSEGVFSLARPLLAAGVPVVVGTLWEVEDEAASALVIDFYRHHREGKSISEELRGSQVGLAMRDGGKVGSARTWAAFVLIGGSHVNRGSYTRTVD